MKKENRPRDINDTPDNYDNDDNDDNKNNIKNKRIITIGKCSRYYLYILYKGLLEFFCNLLLGKDGSSINGMGILGFSSTLDKFNFVKSIFLYIGYIIFGIIFFIYKRVDNEGTFYLLYKEEQTQEKRKLIHNKPKKLFSTNTIKIIVLVCLAFVIHIEIKKVLYNEGFQFFNFWSLEIVFMLYFMKKYFIINYYRHHKVSVIFNTTVCSALLLTASFLPTSLSGENPGNSYDTINKKLGSYFYCILFIFIFIVLSNFYCYSRVNMKVLMQINFLSPYKIILFFGICGFIISLIASIVAYYLDYHDNLFDYFSAMKAVLDQGKIYHFYAEIFLLSPLYTFINFMEITFEILIIFYLNPFYVLMVNTLYYGIIELISYMTNLSSDELKITHFILTECTEVFCCFGLSVFLEIIELRFCGLDDNISKSLIEKGNEEVRKSIHNLEDCTEDEVDDEDDGNEVEEEEKNNKDKYEKKYIGPYSNI